MRSRVNQYSPLAALALLTACGGGGDRPGSILPQPAVIGPAADYPVVVGEPFTVGSTTYTPIDRMNFDAVGYASVGADGGESISAANKTLPLPSYVEVTSLDSGRTILVRVERRGPMSNDRLVELSPGAAAQLGVIGEKTPVRVRRVNPPEPERALLRSGQRAPDRMETPKALVAVLLRRIDLQAPVLLSGPASSAKPGATSRPADKPAGAPAPRPTPAATASAASAATTKPKPSPPPAAAGGLVVQVGAFSSRANADASAVKVGGRVSTFGKLFRVRSGPFATRAEADAALAKAKAAGYSDARIQRAN